MAVLVNFKICDNAPECGGIEVCPTGALYYDEKKETIAIDNDKCISCGKCEKECPIGAIRVARIDEEYKKIKEEIDNDPRTIEDLFVDRYGAAPLSEFFELDEKDIKNKVNEKEITIIELYNDDSIECLIKSIPIKKITESIDKETMFYKVNVSDSLCKEYSIKELPSLLVFKNGILKGKVEGYYKTDEFDNFMSKINKCIEK